MTDEKLKPWRRPVPHIGPATAQSAQAVEDEAPSFELQPWPRPWEPPSKLGPSPTAVERDANEDRNAPWAWAPINNPFPEGTWEHDGYHETECFRQAFARLPNAPRKE